MDRRGFLVSVLGARAVGANDRIVLGCIGVGAMGTGHTRGFLQHPDVRVAAVADVRQAHAERAKALVDKHYGDSSCTIYRDFRALLERKDIDAVMIASPENWHPLMGIEAARRGKHMYYEKPLSVSMAEGWAVRHAVRKHGVVFQFGTQQRSSHNYRFTCELVRNGHIGELRTIMIGSAGGTAPQPVREVLKPVPPGFDYDMWLGPAPFKPYSDERVSRTWMDIRDYGLGCLDGAWGIHDVDAAQWFNDSDPTAPVSVEGEGVFYEDIRDVPYSWTVEHRYANGVRLIHMDLVTAKRRARQFQFGGMASVLIGSKGWIWVSREGMRTEPAHLMQTVIGANEKRVPFSNDHRRDFLNAIRRGRPPISPIDAAVNAEIICQQADIALRLNRKLRWNPGAERFIEDREANRMLTRALRRPWSLEERA